MLSIVVPTLNAAESIEITLRGLQPALDGLAHEVVVADGGSTDQTREIAVRWGARVVAAQRGRGSQLAAGADAAEGAWLLFLHADTVLEQGWREEITNFIARPENARRVAVFRFVLDDTTPAARRLEAIVAWRGRALGLPYGDQGLLIARQLYGALGGYRPIPLMEDVDLIRRVGRSRLVHLSCAARTSAARYRNTGYLRRSTRNLLCLTLFFLGVKPGRLVRLYG